MKKKPNQLTLSLLLVLLLMPILSVLMFVHITVSETIGNMDSGAFGKAYEFINVQSGNDMLQTLFDEVDNMSGNVAITSDGEIEDIPVRSIYFNKSYTYFPMKSGRFFEKKDLCAGNECAVVGKDLEKMIYSKNGNDYIKIQGMELVVLGVIGYESDTIIDEYIYVNGWIQEDLFASTLFLLDFSDAKELEKGMDDFVTNLKQKGIEIERLTGGQNFFNSFVPRLLYSRWFGVMFVCALLCLVLLSYEWMNRQKEEIGIRRLLGATPKDIYILLAKRYGGIILLTMIAGVLYCYVFHPNYKRFLGSGYIVVLPILFIFLTVVCMKIIRTPLEEVMKS